ncbi:unconventional myosin-IXAa-like isoform X2 [Branchiostoma floridae]|uniref:Unconventional myosin-IXAa-like isoform X2 n=1 Tax=Branchiostoma floridae TaxID=7739 RepID=A0A9J7KMM5_BRAFL|nr:unconventional myosin-IXAa-like isoform X2 [Branchiostoma floridae]
MATTTDSAPMANQEVAVEDMHPLQIHPGPLVPEEPFIVLQVAKETTATDVISQLVSQYNLAGGAENYEIAEVCYTGGQNCKERLLQRDECPAQVQLIWPRKMPTTSNKDAAIYKFCLRETLHAFYSRWSVCSSTDSMNALMAEYFRPPSDKDYPDLCRLPDLNEHTLLDNLQVRFNQGKIYTYVGSILIAINPFKFFPIYNPKYVNMYQNHRLGELEPHIFAIADASYHAMLEHRENQCIVISGESGSGKTESTNFLLHHLTALSYKGHASGIEQTILGAGPVLEAFGNAKTAHNDNSSRFGKFIQLNYKENGTVHGATVEKYLLEKSRIVSQASNERNYHVFYYLLAGANQALKDSLILQKPEEFFYLNQSNYEVSEGEDRVFEFNRLRQSMEMVGFYSGTQKRIFAVLSAVLHLGNIVFNRIFRDGEDAVQVKNPEELRIVSKLLKVKEETLLEALTSRTTIARRERIIISHRQAEAVATRDALAKSLYSGLFDWIVLQLNHALLHKEAKGHHQGNWIGVLDIFGFEDFGQQNSFEQFCINFANEHLQYYFNQHVFKLEQEEYQKEGIQWKNIDFIDNTGCLSLIAKRPTGLLHLLDEESRLPNATSETLLTKFHQQHEDNGYYERPQVNEPSFVIVHYAGKVKYQIQDFREKNIDLMRSDIVSVLKNSHMAFVREIISTDPVAVFRWAILRAFFRSVSAFRNAGKRWKANQGKPRPAPRVRPSPRLRSTSSLSEVSDDEEVPTSPLSPALPEDDFSSPTNKALTPRSSPYSTPEAGSRHTSTGHPSRRESGSLFEQEGLLYSTTDPNTAKVLRRAANILMKNKSFRHGRPHKCLRDLRSVKTIVRREGKPSSTLRKAPATVSAQFSVSLSKLMETLNQAKPFFVRCIKSNSDKAPCKFDSQLVLRQLRYTGMLETVRIRQSGYSVRLTFQEFAHQYALLLKRGNESTKEDIAEFLHSMELDDRHYQMGESKVFLRESERLKLQEALHEEVLRRIRVIQVWMRGMLQRKMYLRMKESVIKIQRNIRACLALRRLLAQQQEKRAAISIQSQWRGHRARRKCGEIRRERRAQEQATREMEEAKRRAQEAIEEEKARQKAEAAAEIQTPPHINGSISPQLQRKLESPKYRVSPEVHRPPSPPPFSLNPLLSVRTDASLFTRRAAQSCYVGVQTGTSVSYHSPEYHNTQGYHGARHHHSLGYHNPKPRGLRHHDPRPRNLGYRSYGDPALHSYIRTPKPYKQQDSRRQYSKRGSADALSAGSAFNGQLENIPFIDEDASPVSPEPDDTEVKAEEDKPLQNERRPSASGSSNSGSPRRKPPPVLPKPSSKHVISSLASKEDSQEPRPRLSSSVKDVAKQFEERISPAEEPPVMNRAIRKSASLPATTVLAVQTADEEEPGAGLLGSPSSSTPRLTSPTQTKAALKLHLSEDNITNLERVLSEKKAKIDSGQSPLLETPTSSPSTISSEIQTITKKLRKKFLAPRKRKPSNLTSDEEDSLKTPESIGVAVLPPFCPTADDNAPPPHHDLKTTSLSKAVECGACGKNVVKEGSKCNVCNQVFHDRCCMKALTCYPSGSSKQKKRSKAVAETERVPSPATGMNLKGASLENVPTNVVISNAYDLRQIDAFLLKKINDMNQDDGRRDTIVDVVFKKAMREYHSDLITTYSAAISTNEEVTLRYKDLISKFEKVLENVVSKEKTSAKFPVTLGINAFRGFLDEFVRNYNPGEKQVNKTSPVRYKRRKKDDSFSFNGHRYETVQFNIATFCEQCSNLIKSGSKGMLCQLCKFACHKKCYQKSGHFCKGFLYRKNRNSGSYEDQYFGADISTLLPEGRKVPVLVEKCISFVEKEGLYTVGIYRKSGAAAKIKQLRDACNADVDAVDMEAYPIHVVCNVLKLFFREMAEPLLTYALYEDFLRCTVKKTAREKEAKTPEMTEEARSETIRAIYDIIDRLPKPNHDTFERLVFHLARVAYHEDSNLMTPNSLAIVFTPCILQTNKELSPLESMQHISKTTMCLELVISEQLKKMRSTLTDINTLESAEISACKRLTTLRRSMHNLQAPHATIEEDDLEDVADEMDVVENGEVQIHVLEQNIRSLQDEKEQLTAQLPCLELRHGSSDDDNLSSDDQLSHDFSLSELDAGNEEYAVTFDLPVSPPQGLVHFTKLRSTGPRRQRPERYSSRIFRRPAPSKRSSLASSRSLSRSEEELMIMSPPVWRWAREEAVGPGGEMQVTEGKIFIESEAIYV